MKDFYKEFQIWNELEGFCDQVFIKNFSKENIWIIYLALIKWIQNEVD